MKTIKLKPQPIGIFPLPASFLLLPEIADAAEFHQQLLQGKSPFHAPEAWQFYLSALQGDVSGALQKLAPDDSPIALYNRFVLQPDANNYAKLRHEFDGELLQMLHIVAYTLGFIESPPQTDGLDDELLAFALMAQASHKMELQDYEGATALLEQGITAAQEKSPLLAAQLTGSLADMQYSLGGAQVCIVQLYKQVLQALAQSELHEMKASLWLNLGINYQELAANQHASLLEAVRCYQEALRVFTRDTHAEQYALAQNNLALAYLAIPMKEANDQLRMAIAVQALREALKVYTRDTHPHLWASAQLNLANALQYLPSSHPQENLAEAVELYEEILAVRNVESDPLGYARLLANQANSLAHLGIFAHATEKLVIARDVFAQYGEFEAAETVCALLKEIAESQKAARLSASEASDEIAAKATGD
jgi:tetratricopeptide (TPR) repeat protein